MYNRVYSDCVRLPCITTGVQLWCTAVVYNCSVQLWCTAAMYSCGVQPWCTVMVYSCGVCVPFSWYPDDKSSKEMVNVLLPLMFDASTEFLTDTVSQSRHGHCMAHDTAGCTLRVYFR